MGMIDMGFTGGPSMSADSQVLPDWVTCEKFYNCENFMSEMGKNSSDLDRFFQRVLKLFR